MWAAPTAPTTRPQRREIYQEHARRLVGAGMPILAFAAPQRLEQVRQEQIKHKQNPRYDGTCRRLDPDEAAAARGCRRAACHPLQDAREKARSPSTTSCAARSPSKTATWTTIILVKSDGLALYHLAAMVDDHLMEITHVIRGSEWLSTFPLHAHIIRAFGWESRISSTCRSSSSRAAKAR